METDPTYTFVPLSSKKYTGINDKRVQEYLQKWGLKGNIMIQNFSFNEPFQVYQKFHLAECFFKDKVVAKHLLAGQVDSWNAQGSSIATTVDVKQVPCSVLSMSFFDKLNNPENHIVHVSGTICKKYDDYIDGFLVADELRNMLLNEESAAYSLYVPDERDEFIFRLFQLFVLGGVLCQYEDILQPYLNVTKTIYKDLARVRKQNNTDDMFVGTLILEVTARDSKGQAYFPYDPTNIQNVAFLLIDGESREITTFLHQFRACCSN